MADAALSKLLETQVSLTEWLERTGNKNSDAMREEDNLKRIRIGEISKITGMPFDQPTSFEASEVAERSPKFLKFLEKKGKELCALRLIPKKGTNVEKIRNRGLSIEDVLVWFDGLEIDPSNYTADFVPHIDSYSWATIFVVNNKGIFGEIFLGGHHILTQGLYDKEPPITFSYDFNSWTLSPENADAEAYLKEMSKYIHITDEEVQKELKNSVNAEFTHEYIKGYFETTHSPDVGTWFIDYNRILGKRYEDFILQESIKDNNAITKGRVASPGVAIGKVRIIEDPLAEEIQQDEVLVCAMTTPDYIPQMIKSLGVITDQGGILCHAAIVAREINKPCIVGTGNATVVLKNGDTVRMDTETGNVYKI